jgi:hypothetical protein
MAAVSLMESMIFRETQREFEKRLLDCEIPEKCDPQRPLWKVTLVPGKNPVETNSIVAGGQ